MTSTHQTLLNMCSVVSLDGIHRGEQFGHPATTSTLARLDICAIAYVVAQNLSPINWPEVFYTDECASMDLIEASEPAMAAIRAISTVLDTEVNETDGQPDYIEHVSTWAMTPPVGCTQPPTAEEVIGRILRAATEARKTRTWPTDAHGLCTTCGGHGSLTTGREEIPYEELSTRRKQGHELGHRFYRNQSKACPHCDGQDRATDYAVSAYEASL